MDVELDKDGYPPPEMDKIREAVIEALRNTPHGERVHASDLNFDYTDDVTDEYEDIL